MTYTFGAGDASARHMLMAAYAPSSSGVAEGNRDNDGILIQGIEDRKTLLKEILKPGVFLTNVSDSDSCRIRFQKYIDAGVNSGMAWSIEHCKPLNREGFIGFYVCDKTDIDRLAQAIAQDEHAEKIIEGIQRFIAKGIDYNTKPSGSGSKPSPV